jgi:hypothetical protein
VVTEEAVQLSNCCCCLVLGVNRVFISEHFFFLGTTAPVGLGLSP